MLTILHASDLQCGRPFLAAPADALVRFAHETRPDVIVLSGDLTQRAKQREYAQARELIGRLPRVPVLVTPGNHDVPLWRVWERALAPYRNWRAAFGPDLDTVTRIPGATFVALNSSAPRRTLVNGRLDRGQIEFARRAFAAAPAEDVRALVIHHHFVPTPDGGGGPPMPGARAHVRAFEAMGVDLVLGGHVHQTHLRTSADLGGDPSVPGVPLLACGTTTSRRGRGPEAGKNSLNLVRVGPNGIEALPHLLGESGTFDPVDRIVFSRRLRDPRSESAATRSGS